MEDSSIQRSSVVTAIVWHPVRKILAIGWQSGDVLIWNEHDHELHEASSIHQSAVQVIQWSNNGNRLVTSDQVCSNEGWSVTMIIHFRFITYKCQCPYKNQCIGHFSCLMKDHSKAWANKMKKRDHHW